MLIDSAISRVNFSEPSDDSRVTAIERRAFRDELRAKLAAAREARIKREMSQSSTPEGGEGGVKVLFTPEQRKGILNIMEKLGYID